HTLERETDTGERRHPAARICDTPQQVGGVRERLKSVVELTRLLPCSTKPGQRFHFAKGVPGLAEQVAGTSERCAALLGAAHAYQGKAESEPCLRFCVRVVGGVRNSLSRAGNLFQLPETTPEVQVLGQEQGEKNRCVGVVEGGAASAAATRVACSLSSQASASSRRANRLETS